MGRDNAKTRFSSYEMARIEQLVLELEKAPADKQKGIRGKVRKIGLYWSEVGSGKAYTVQNLRQLIQLGVIKVEGGADSPGRVANASTSSSPIRDTRSGGRANSDEQYVIDLCNEALGLKGLQQYKFPFLLGDSGKRLPVDVYYPKLNLVIEYYERQHTESVRLFDRKMTVSGVTRDEQRRIYDERRRTVLPKHGIKLVIISYADFGTSKKLARNHDMDLLAVKSILNKNGIPIKYKAFAQSRRDTNQ